MTDAATGGNSPARESSYNSADSSAKFKLPYIETASPRGSALASRQQRAQESGQQPHRIACSDADTQKTAMAAHMALARSLTEHERNVMWWKADGTSASMDERDYEKYGGIL